MATIYQSSPNFLLNYHQQCLFFIYLFITKLIKMFTNQCPFQSPNLITSHQNIFSIFNLNFNHQMIINFKFKYQSPNDYQF